MLQKILIKLGVFILLICFTIFIFFYKTDLTKEELADRYINSTSKFIKLSNGAEMHYRDNGTLNKHVIVMIHGGFGSLHNWEGWVENLKKEYRVISMDLLGHGLTGAYPSNIYTRHSQRDAIHELLNILNIKKYILEGNSFGGGIALEMALKYPEEVKGLILVDSEGIPNSENGYDASQFTNEKPITPDEREYTKLSFLERMGSKFIGSSIIKKQLESMIFNKNLINDDFVDFYGRILRYKGNREAQILMFRQELHLVVSGHKMDLLPRLKEIRCPTLVMAGENDTLVPVSVSEKFNNEIKVSELRIIPNTGHMPMIEKPNETVKIVKHFLNKHNI
ncbi:alpha/beta fold hydrolase [Tenacibaculum aiptasiae]|uniref:alpha/beta fold hydrolase n=1 Tax=Tenacibaculum aiptasiae TaxID=426481 RepID=UPI00232AE921|nr:alpha/beta hydrolase [Tenacibaculum aiptasiae]